MARFRLAFVLIAFTILSSGIVVSEAQNVSKGGTFQLRVTTSSPQPVPIENAGVKIRQLSDGESSPANQIRITGTSDANGEYRQDNLPVGLYYVTVSKNSYHTMFSMNVRENRVTDAGVRLPIFDETADTNVLPSQETDAKWVIRGKIFETDFQETPVSGVEVRLMRVDEKPSTLSDLSDADGEYEFVLPPGHYGISLYKEGYEFTFSLLEVTAESRQSSVTVIEEDMFVVYEAVADGNVLALKHGISQKRFSEKYGRTIRFALLSVIIGGILGLLVRHLKKRQQEHNQE